MRLPSIFGIVQPVRRGPQKAFGWSILVVIGFFYLGWRWYRGHRYDSLIAAAAKQSGLPPALVKAVIWKESRFNPDARGGTGELGLMQLREDAAQKWADARHLKNFEHAWVLDPETNTLAGCYYLSYVLRRYSQTDNPFAYALADYNAGRGNVLRWTGSNAPPAAKTNSRAFLSAITFPGTRSYVTEILARRSEYEGDFPPADEPAFH